MGHAVAVGKTGHPSLWNGFFVRWTEVDLVIFLDILLAEETQVDNQARVSLRTDITV